MTETYTDIRTLRQAFGSDITVQIDLNLLAILQPEERMWYIFNFDTESKGWKLIATSLKITALEVE